MKVVILAGGRGTRLSEETSVRPKPMVEIGGRPILWHIMQIYAAHGHSDFIVATGYKDEVIKEYFAAFRQHASDFTIDLATGEVRTLSAAAVPEWRVSVVHTGDNTMTGGRLLRLRDHLEGEPFMVTYGDGVADVDLGALFEHHRHVGGIGTVTAVRPPARFGALELNGDLVGEFSEKVQAAEGWINGGFFVFEPEFLGYLEGDESVLERTPLERLAADGQLAAYRHTGFWQPMDTLRDKMTLEDKWSSGMAPWKVWE